MEAYKPIGGHTVLELEPNLFHRVQMRTIGRQVNQLQSADAPQPGLDEFGGVAGIVIDNQQDRSRIHRQEMLQKDQESLLCAYARGPDNPISPCGYSRPQTTCGSDWFRAWARAVAGRSSPTWPAAGARAECATHRRTGWPYPRWRPPPLGPSATVWRPSRDRSFVACSAEDASSAAPTDAGLGAGCWRSGSPCTCSISTTKSMATVQKVARYPLPWGS